MVEIKKNFFQLNLSKRTKVLFSIKLLATLSTLVLQLHSKLNVQLAQSGSFTCKMLRILLKIKLFLNGEEINKI